MQAAPSTTPIQQHANGSVNSAPTTVAPEQDPQVLVQQNAQLRTNMSKLKTKLLMLSKFIQVSELLDKSK